MISISQFQKDKNIKRKNTDDDIKWDSKCQKDRISVNYNISTSDTHISPSLNTKEYLKYFYGLDWDSKCSSQINQYSPEMSHLSLNTAKLINCMVGAKFYKQYISEN